MNSRFLIILISLLVFTLSCSDGTIIELTSPDGVEKEDNSLRITSPNGGEDWLEGSTQTITFFGGGEENGPDYGGWYYYVLYYSIDGGEIWIPIATPWTHDGEAEYNWTVPVFHRIQDKCRIKVSYGESYGIDDISDNNFTIRAKEPSNLITILQPNGSEILNERTTQEIIWFTTGDIGGNDVSLAYSLNSGIEWSNISSSTPNDGSHDWTLPNISDIADYCLIGIWSVADENIYKTSDDFFTIIPDSSYYSIQQPNGGEILQSGEEYQILWTSGGDVGSVEIYYSIFGGESWYLIDNYESNDGSFTWSVPSVQGTNDACKIKIQSIDREDWFDVSDADFTISNN